MSLCPIRLVAGFLPFVLLAIAGRAQTFRFEDVSSVSGLYHDPTNGSASIAVGDFDGDGWEDVVIAGRVVPRLFRNQFPAWQAGQATHLFADVSAQWLPSDAEPGSMVVLGDLDNDGDADLVVVRHFWNPATQEWNPNDTALALFENKGAHFERVPCDPDLGRWDKGHGGIVLADMDVDGDLDIVFVHRGSAAFGGDLGPGFYVRNDGLPSFVDATASAGGGLATPRRHLALVSADFNGDRLPDLHSAVDQFSDYHAHNSGGGTFADVTTLVGAVHLGSDMGLAVGDIENDGDLDIFSTNIDEGVLYLNDGTGTFVNDADARGIGIWPGNCIGWGTVFADFDLDRDEDLAVVGMNDPGFLFENDGQGYFANATAGSGAFLLARALVHFDFDRDGDLDLLQADNPTDTPVLYRNRTPREGRHWITFDPVGSADNRDGVATRIEITAGGRRQVRVTLVGSSFHGAPTPTAHFGLGDAAMVDGVKVTWPNGQVQRLLDVPADQHLTLVQP